MALLCLTFLLCFNMQFWLQHRLTILIGTTACIAKQTSQIQHHSFQNTIYLRTAVFPGPSSGSEMYPNHTRPAVHSKFESNLLVILNISKTVEEDPECMLHKIVFRTLDLLSCPVLWHLASAPKPVTFQSSPLSNNYDNDKDNEMNGNEYDKIPFTRCLFCSPDCSRWLTCV